MTPSAKGPSNPDIVRMVLVVAAMLLLLYAAFRVRSILILILVSGFLAVGLDPAVRRLERFGIRRGFAISLIFVATIAVAIAFVAAVVPPLVSQVADFATNLPDYVQNLARRNPKIREFVATNDIPTRLRQATQNVPSLISGSFSSVLGVAGSVITTIFNALTVLVLTIYFSLSLAHIREGTLRLVPKSKRDRTADLLDPIFEKIGGYIAGQATVSLIAGVLAFIFLAIAGVPFPIALALWVTISDLIPLVGATLGAVPSVIVAFFASPALGIATVVYFIAYQQIENYVIAPRVMTKAVDITPAAVLLSALIGATLLGFVGALMAIPAAASIKLIVQEVVLPRAEAA